MLASTSAPQYCSIDISNTNIRPLVTILWQNTKEQQNFTHSLTYLIEICIATRGRDNGKHFAAPMYSANKWSLMD